eukprot:646784-Pelagomonas_calceolata.AAC.1
MEIRRVTSRSPCLILVTRVERRQVPGSSKTAQDPKLFPLLGCSLPILQFPSIVQALATIDSQCWSRGKDFPLGRKKINLEDKARSTNLIL